MPQYLRLLLFFCLVALAVIFVPTKAAQAAGGNVDAGTCASFAGTWDGVNTCTLSNLTLNSGETLTIPAGVVLSVTGFLVNGLDNNGAFTTTATILNSGTISIANIFSNGSTLVNDGTLNIYGVMYQYFAVENQGTIYNDGYISNFGTIENDGTLINAFADVIGDRIDNSGTISNTGGIVNEGNFNNYFGTIANTGSIVNDGDFINSGTITNDCPGTITGTIGGNQPINNWDEITSCPPVVYVKPQPTGTGTGDSWNNATTLQSALSAGPDLQIWAATGVYTPGAMITSTFLLSDNIEIYGGFAATETLRSQRNWEANPTVLSGDLFDDDSFKDANGVVTDKDGINGTNAYHVVTGLGVSTTAVLDGFFITAGAATGTVADPCGPGCGGGIMLNSSSPTLANLILSGNTAGYGGGMYNNVSHPSLTNVVFRNNEANMGGGMANFTGNPSLTDVVFLENQALIGGGIHNDLSTALRLTNVTFVVNVANQVGGGMNNSSSTPTLINVTFDRNVANEGGGMANNGSNPTLVNVAFGGNLASTIGGGMVNEVSNPTLTNVTLFYNSAAAGGGIYNREDSAPLIQNSILWYNQGFPDPNLSVADGTTPTIRYSLVENFTTAVDGNLDGFDFANDPQFLLAPNPYIAESGDLRLKPTSAVIDKGDNAADLDGSGPGTTTIADILTDLPGSPRIVGGVVDFGAYEAVPTPLHVRQGANGNGTGDSWANAVPDLRTALVRAVPGTEIWVATGVYTPGTLLTSTFLLPSETQIYGGFAATETLRSQRNWTANPTVLSGDLFGDDSFKDASGVVTHTDGINGINAYHVVSMVDSSAQFLDGFFITAGSATGAETFPCVENCGGGMFIIRSEPNLLHLEFRGNRAQFGGGLATPEARPRLTNITFLDNTASFGGGMYSSIGSPRLTDVIFRDNLATFSGGGLEATNETRLTLVNGTFTGNRADSGRGGGMNTQNGSDVILVNTLFSGNYAGSGGGFAMEDSNPRLTNVTVSGNSAMEAGGIYLDEGGNLLLQNSIVWGNVATDAPNLNEDEDATATISSTVVQSYTTAVNGNLDGFNPANAPQFVRPVSCEADGCTDDLATPNVDESANDDYGDLRLIGSSPSVDSGDNSADTGTGRRNPLPIAAIATDLAGLPRIVAVKVLSPTVDMGAYETPASPPVFLSSPSLAGVVDILYTYAISTSDPDQPGGSGLALSAPIHPVWLNFTPGSNGTGTLTGTPGNDDMGSEVVTLQVQDSGGLTATQTFTVVVINVNDAPSFASAPVTNAVEDIAYTYAVTTTDPDEGDTRNISLLSASDWLGLVDNGNGTATLSGTPTNAQVGSEVVTLQVQDSGGLTTTQTFTVVVTNVNDAPSFASAPVTNAVEDIAYTYAVTTTDLDVGDTRNVSLVAGPAWLGLTPGGNGTGMLGGTPTNANIGSHGVTLQVQDSGGLTTTQTFTVVVTNVNDAPSFASAPVTNAVEDIAYTYAMTTTDLDVGDTRNVSLVVGPAWLGLTPGGNGTGMLGGTPTNADVGSHGVTLQVQDSGGITATQRFTVTVANVNDTPGFTSAPVTVANQDNPYIYAVMTTDPDVGDTRNVGLLSASDWLGLVDNGNGTAILSGTPGSDDVGSEVVTLQVQDSGGLTTTQRFTVTITATPVLSGSIQGQVLIGSEGVEGVTVTVNSEVATGLVAAAGEVAQDVTDGSGNYRFDGLPVGTYVLTLAAPEGYFTPAPLTVVVEADQTTIVPNVGLQPSTRRLYMPNIDR